MGYTKATRQELEARVARRAEKRAAKAAGRARELAALGPELLAELSEATHERARLSKACSYVFVRVYKARHERHPRPNAPWRELVSAGFRLEAAKAACQSAWQKYLRRSS